jgi:hypothetical protein
MEFSAKSSETSLGVIPAKAGIHPIGFQMLKKAWIPFSKGMTAFAMTPSSAAGGRPKFVLARREPILAGAV